MTSFRKFCCNDLLELTPILMDQFATTQKKPVDQNSLSWYLKCMAEFPDYFVVATSPGKRIKGYCTAIIEEDDAKSQRCTITHVAVGERWKQEASELANLFVDKVDEISYEIDSVDCLSILPSTNLHDISVQDMLQGSAFENHVEAQTEDEE